MGKAGEPRQVERKIYFYRADAGSDAGGAPVGLDLADTLQKVEAVPFAADSKRYWLQRGGDAIGLWMPSSSHTYDRFVLAAVRRSSFPQSELNGTLADLDLGAGAGLHEPIHVRLYPDNLVGIEFNFHGPRPSRLPLYLQHVIPGAPKFMLEALLRKDAEDQLLHQSEMRLLDLHLRPSYIAEVRKASKSLGEAFEAMTKVSKAEVIGITLRPEPNKRTPLGNRVLKGTRKLAGRSDLSENVVKFKAKGINDLTGKVETINLLDDQLVSHKKIVTLGPNSRAVDSTAAFDAIDAAYETLKPQLLEASGISAAQDDGS
ncbi:hypothetical protein ACHMXB_22840 (plasmid) [Arthrobacter sp. UC242_113]|uniref:hypothetical protein n=1 Tax=Arthrobacter sp. UC242_113 TaxID=3374550 RepID=UPI003757A18A